MNTWSFPVALFQVAERGRNRVFLSEAILAILPTLYEIDLLASNYYPRFGQFFVTNTC